jgi:hypothetical protein
MSLDSLHRQLAMVARQRVHSGELTERGLARLCGVSQPHMHNVLKGIRSLSTASADRLLVALNLSVPELIWRASGPIDTGVQAVPVLRNRLGPGTDAALDQFNGYMPFPAAQTASLVDPVAARVAPDLVLPGPLATNDLVLLDQNPLPRETPSPRFCWVISDGASLRIRYAGLTGAGVSIANESNVHNPRLWRFIPLHERGILDVVKARVVWIGRELPAP